MEAKSMPFVSKLKSMRLFCKHETERMPTKEIKRMFCLFLLFLLSKKGARGYWKMNFSLILTVIINLL